MLFKSLGILLITAITASAYSQPLWVNSFGGDWMDIAADLVEDAFGNVYVVGSFNDTIDLDPGDGEDLHYSSGQRDLFIQKLDANGDYIWGITIGGDKDDGAGEVCLDASGNVLIGGGFHSTVDFDPGAGEAIETTEKSQFFILSLTEGGDFNWVYRPFQMSEDGRAWVGDLDVDQTGNICVVGGFKDTVNFDPYGTDTTLVAPTLTIPVYDDMFILKLDDAGNFLWVKQMGGNRSDYLSNIKVDEEDHLVVTGYFNDTISFDTPTGDTLFPVSDEENAGSFVAKFDSDGLLLWINTFPPPAGWSTGLELSSTNEIILAGNYDDGFNADPSGGTFLEGVHDIFIEKFDSDGNFLWAKGIHGLYYNRCYAMDVGPDDDIYLTGYYTSEIDLDPGPEEHLIYSELFIQPFGPWEPELDMFVVKLDANGDFLWGNVARGLYTSIGTGMEASSDGSAIFCGYFQDTTRFSMGGPSEIHFGTGSVDAFVIKLGGYSHVDELVDVNSIRLFPNPANDHVTIITGDAECHELQLYGMSGRLIHKEAISSSTIQMQLGALPAGIYTIRLIGDSEVRELRFVKSR